MNARMILLLCLLAGGTVAAWAQTYVHPEDSAFVAKASHAVAQEGQEARRKDWAIHTYGLTFGYYSLSVTQRLDPATGNVPPSTIWGDAFAGIGGKRPAFYMASNWSPWDFLYVNIRLAGTAKELPNPTIYGRMQYAILREVTPQRIIAEAAWQDTTGGIVRARFVGWKGVQYFGLLLRYFPAAGKTVEQLTYTLRCQPYDYSDRGFWERQRWFATPARAEKSPDKPLALEVATEWQLVFHNRRAMTDAGTTLAFEKSTVQEATVAGQGVIACQLAPKKLDGECILLLGDWVDEEYVLVSDAYFADQARIAGLLTSARTMTIPPLPRFTPAREDAEIDALLAKYPELETAFGDKVRSAVAAAKEAWEPAAGDDPFPTALATWIAAQDARTAAQNEVRAAWVKQRLWEK